MTHSFDQNQHVDVLAFKAGNGKLVITAPASPDLCPPGHYMLFILNKAGVPSVARIIQIEPAGTSIPIGFLRDNSAFTDSVSTHATLSLMEAAPFRARRELLILPVVSPGLYQGVNERAAEIVSSAKGTAVVLGITGTCPYGIGACWGGAYEALSRLDDVDMVEPFPHARDSTARVFLKDDRLPPLTLWNQQFRSVANGSYVLRGVEVTLRGMVRKQDGQLRLIGKGSRPTVRLVPAGGTDKIQWDAESRSSQPLDAEERGAFMHIESMLTTEEGGKQMTVTGPLQQTEIGEYLLYVRQYDLETQ